MLALLPLFGPEVSAQPKMSSPTPAEEDGGDAHPEGLTLSEAARLAVLKSPRLSSYSWDIRAAEASAIQAAVRPNPQLAVELEDALGTGEFEGVRQAQTTISVSQLFELGGKRALRTAAADALTESARKEYDLKTKELMADVATMFIEVLSAQAENDLATTAISVARESLKTANKRADAGKGSLLEVHKAEIALRQAELTREHETHELGAKRRTLAGNWPGAGRDFKVAIGDLYAAASLPPIEELESRLADSPEVQRVAAERSLRAERLRMEESRSIPDVSVGAGVRRLEGPDDTAFLVSFSAPLPIFDRNMGRRQEVAALLRKSDDDAESAKARAGALLFALHGEFSHMRRELEVIRESIAPKSEKALALAREGYEAGRFSYLDLLDAARTLLEVKRRRIEVAETQHKLAIEVERLIGISQY